MSQSPAKPVQIYEPHMDGTRDLTQEEYDLLEYRMQLVQRIVRNRNIETLKALCKVLNDKHE